MPTSLFNMLKMAMVEQVMSSMDDDDSDEENQPTLTFNETGQEVSSMRKGMLDYLARKVRNGGRKLRKCLLKG